MRKKLLLFFLLASAAWPQAQPPSTYQPQLISFIGVPFGPCDIYQFALNNITGDYYSCVIQTRTWKLLAGGGGGGTPRLDQVLNQNQGKLFNQGAATIGFTAGPGIDFSGETSAMAIPAVGSCTTSASGQICFDSTNSNYHLYNGADSLLPLFSSSFVSGDVAGLSLSAGKWTVTDLGPLNPSSGTGILNITYINPQIGDSFCVTSLGPPLVVENCTPGVPPVVISGTTYNYDGTGSAAPERGDILFFTNASGAALSLPQPSAGGVINANWFTFVKADGGTLTLTSGGTSTFFENGTHTKTIGTGEGCSIFSDPGGNGTYYTKCAMVPFTAGSGITITPAAYSIAIAATGGNNATLGVPTPTWKAVSGSYTVPDSDQGLRDLDGTASAVWTIGTPNSISTSPIVATRIQVGNISSSPFTTASFSQSASNQLAVIVANDSGTPRAVNTITDVAGDSFSKKCETISGGATSVSIWLATGIAANGANTATITWASNPGRAQVYIVELTGSAFDTAACTTGSLVSTQIHFANALALGVGFDGLPASWSQNGAVNGSEADNQLQHNVGQVTYGIAGANPTAAIGLMALSISSQPTFVSGWYFTAENTSGGNQALTPTAATIDGRSSVTMVPNEVCSPLSNGSNYNASCGFTPDVVTAGVIGAAIQNNGVFTTNAVADVGATTLVTNGAQDALFQVNASVVCKSSVNASETLTILYTDTNSIAQTKTASTGTCNGGTPTDGDILATMMVKASTVIQYQTTHTTATPTYDVRVMITQVSSK